MAKMGRPTKAPSDLKRRNIAFRVTDEIYARIEEGARQNECSVAEEVRRRVEQSCPVARPATAEDIRLMIREEIRAALAADRAAQAEVSELLMRDTVETMRVGMAVAERRNFGPRPEAIYGCNGEPKASWKV